MSGFVAWLRANASLFPALGAMIVSLGALYFAWEQGRLMRMEQEIAVWPALQINTYSDRSQGDLHLGIRVENAGVGPALVRTVEVTRADELIETRSDFQQHWPEGYDLSNNILTGRILAAGGVVRTVDLRWPAERVDEAFLTTVIEEGLLWGVEVCYCSAFDRCWVSRNDALDRPREVAACPEPRNIEF